jgi:dTDP-glucose 4,6-dehydratase
MKALITGGAGFIGSQLIDYLLSKGLYIVCVDNLLTGSVENIKHNLDNKKFQFIRHDISQPIKIAGKIDYVLHLASPASPKDYEKYPILTLKVGSQGTANALQIAKNKKAKFLLASTSEVYGDPLLSPQVETYWGNVNPVGPRSCYDEAKRFAEAITMAYYREYKVDIRIARIFNTYGPRMKKDDGRVIPNFINQALSRKPLTIYGKGKQTRSFCYISDLVEGLYGLLLSKENFPVNLGNPNEFTILELAKLTHQMIGRNQPVGNKLVFKKLPQDDPKQRCPDINRARKLLKWEPKIELRQGLQETINWFKEYKR